MFESHAVEVVTRMARRARKVDFRAVRVPDQVVASQHLLPDGRGRGRFLREHEVPCVVGLVTDGLVSLSSSSDIVYDRAPAFFCHGKNFFLPGLKHRGDVPWTASLWIASRRSCPVFMDEYLRER